MTKNLNALLALADSELIKELRQGTKEVCTNGAIHQAITIRLHKQAQDTANTSLLVATMSDKHSQEISYTHVSNLTNESLVLFDVTCYEVSNVSKLQSVFSDADNRSMKVKQDYFILADSEKVHIVDSDSDNLNCWGFEIGNAWLLRRLGRFMSKGKRGQWKYLKSIDNDSTIWTINYNADKRN